VDIYQQGPTLAQQEQQRRRAAAMENWNSWLAKAVLLPNTIDPGASINGFVFFPRENKKHREIVVRIPLRDVTYEFPLIPQ
jgi:hypothetical protein